MPLSKGVTIVFSSLGTSKKWTGNTSITFFISQNTHIQWHVSKKFQGKSTIILMTTRLIGVLCWTARIKIWGFSQIKFQNFPRGGPPDPPFILPYQCKLPSGAPARCTTRAATSLPHALTASAPCCGRAVCVARTACWGHFVYCVFLAEA